MPKKVNGSHVYNSLPLRSERCRRRGWHRCRDISTEIGAQSAAVCLDCGECGGIKWAVKNLLREVGQVDASSSAAQAHVSEAEPTRSYPPKEPK